MQYLMAPLEGVTSNIFRNAYARYYGGIDRYFTPFISLHQNKSFNFKELREILPEQNPGICLVPQVLTNSSADFLCAARAMADMGYRHVNVNFGCPSATVVPKRKGAGILGEPELLDRFLEEVFAETPVAVSVKTRIGLEDLSEWPRIFAIYEKYPLEELIVHPRLRGEYYQGTPHREVFGEIVRTCTRPLVYNGDVFTAARLQETEQTYPELAGIMLGRGLIACPGLLRQRQTGEPPDRERFRAFHGEIFEGYLARGMGDRNVLFRMKELWFYFLKSFEPVPELERQLKKAETRQTYLAAVNRIFREAPLSADPERTVRFI